MEIGPSLPPHLSKKKKEESKEETTVHVGPSLPPHLSKQKKEESKEETTVHVGPSLPPNFVERKREEEDEEDDDPYGPALPPHLAQARKSQRNIGPSLPGQQDTFKSDQVQQRQEDSDSDDEIVGPVIGPMPSSSSDQVYSSIEQDIEARSKAMKDKLLGKNNVKQKREEWMTELPPEMSKNFGLGPRTFRKQAVDCGDRSVWIDTPSDKNKKQEQANRKRPAEDHRAPWEEEKEKNMNKMIDSYTKQHRGESLMDIHQRELNKKRKEEGIKPNERRPFDRDRDLGPTPLDPEKRKSLLKKSQQLDTRFLHSKSGSSFL